MSYRRSKRTTDNGHDPEVVLLGSVRFRWSRTSDAMSSLPERAKGTTEQVEREASIVSSCSPRSNANDPCLIAGTHVFRPRAR